MPVWWSSRWSSETANFLSTLAAAKRRSVPQVLQGRARMAWKVRMDGIHALILWDLVIEIFHSVTNKIEQPKEEFRGDPLQATKPNMHNPFQVKHTNVIPTHIDHIQSNTNTMHFEFGGNQNDCQRSKCHTTIRHVLRTHKVALDCLFDIINFDPKFKSVTLIPNTSSQTY